MKRILGWLHQVLLKFYVEPLKETLIDTGPLAPALKILVRGGYVIIGLLLVLTLVFELIGARLPMVELLAFQQGEAVSQFIPIAVVVVSSFGATVAWAYIMTGATDCRRRIFLPVLGLLGMQLFFMTFPSLSGLAGASGLPFIHGLLACGSAPLLLLGAFGFYMATHRQAYWRDYPLLEFGGWITIMLFYFIQLWVAAPDRESVAAAIDTSFTVTNFMVMPWWFFSGLTLVHIALNLGHTLMIALRRLLPNSLLRIAALFVVLVHPTVVLFATAFSPDTTSLPDFFIALFIDGVLALPLMLLLLVLAIGRRWNTKNAAMLLTLSSALPFFSAGFTLALKGTELFNLIEITAERANTVAPTLIFVGLMAYNVLSMGSAFANRDGQFAPRSGRALLGLGAAILITSGALFSAQTRDATGALNEDFKSAVDAFFTLGVFFLGLPYLVWTIWKHRERLSGDDEKLKDVVPVLAPLEGRLGRKTRIALTIGAIFLALFVCLLGMVLISPPQF